MLKRDIFNYPLLLFQLINFAATSQAFIGTNTQRSILLPIEPSNSCSKEIFVHHSRNPFPPKGKGNINVDDYDYNPNDLVKIEQDMYKKVNERLDIKRVEDALLENGGGSYAQYERDMSVPVSAGIFGAASSFLVIHNMYFSAVSFVVFWILASGDPNKEDGLGGAIARILGRYTARSIEQSKPKVQSVLRATIKGDEELIYLRTRVEELESENQKLKTWVEKRMAVDDSLKNYSLTDLRKIARKAGMQGISTMTKPSLMMKLIDDGVIDWDSIRSGKGKK